MNITVSKADVTTKEGCSKLLKEAIELGPVNAIFNLAAVLKDALFENQTEESFRITLLPKAQATMYLDEISRQLCPDLRLKLITKTKVNLNFFAGILLCFHQSHVVWVTLAKQIMLWQIR